MVKSVLKMELSKPKNDFSLSQLVQIFEASELEIVEFLVEEIAAEVQVSLSHTQGDIQSCLASLRRYGFEILSVEGPDVVTEQLAENAAYLNTYLNI